MSFSCIKKSFPKAAAFILALVCLLCSVTFSVLPASADISTSKNEEIYSYYLWEDYEASPSQLPFNATIKNTSASFIGGNSKLRTVDWNVIDDNRSLEVQSCDMRWWSLSVYADEIYAGFDFMSLGDSFANSFDYCINTQDDSTGTEGSGGSVIKISADSNGKPVVKNAKNKTVATLENKTVYSFLLVFKRGSANYEIYINNIPYTDNEFVSATYSVKGLRITADSRNESSFVLDNVSLFTLCKYPQAFSAQEKIKEPDAKLPEYKEQTETRAYYNDTEIRLSSSILHEDGTHYIVFKDFLDVIGGSFTESDGNISITAPDFSASVSIGSNEGISNGSSVSFNNSPKKSNGKIFVPLNMINVLFGMKVWYDETGDMIVISNKEFSSDDILRLLNCRFYMNGEPYYEMSFNKFDLVYQIAPDYFGFTSSYPNENFTYKAAEKAIEALSENGFRTIRFFCICGDPDVLCDQEKKEKYYQIMDAAFDLLDKYGIQANVDLCTISDQFLAREFVEGAGWVQKTETTTDLVAYADSESRQFLYDYIEEFVGRYKDRHSVLMWEIQNEAALGADIGQGRAPGYSLMQLGKFYADVAAKIKSVDSKHLVSSGDACLRTSQYHQFLATIAGENIDWSTDTLGQRLKALSLLDYGIDVISVHTYSWGTKESGSSAIDDETGEEILMDYTHLINEAKKLGKALYSGEFSGTVPYSDMPITDPDIAVLQTNYLNSVIEQGVQLSHWWTFESNRQGFGDDTAWNVSLKRHKFTFDAIAEANKNLKAKYVVNAAAADNTAEPTSTLPVSDSYDSNPVKKSDKTWLIISACAAVVVIAAAVVMTVILVKKKKK